jgi:hypothetical protein
VIEANRERDKLKNIFIGMLFVFLDFNIHAGASTIELIPDFVGYIIMLQGIKELLEESNWFQKITSFTIGMAIYSAVIYMLDLLGVSASFSTGLESVFFVILSIITFVLILYINYGIIMGVRDMEIKHKWELGSEILHSAWRVLAMLSVLSYLLIVIPYFNFFGIIAIFVAHIYYLYCFNKSKNMYYSSL